MAQLYGVQAVYASYFIFAKQQYDIAEMKLCPYSFDSFAVHLVMYFWFGEEETGITFLVDQQVREVDLMG